MSEKVNLENFQKAVHHFKVIHNIGVSLKTSQGICK